MAKKDQEKYRGIVDRAIQNIKSEVNQQTLDAYMENRDFLEQIGVEGTLDLFKLALPGNEAKIESLAVSKYMDTLTDEQLLKVWKADVKSMESWASIEARKIKLAKDLVGNIGKVAASIIVQSILLEMDNWAQSHQE